MKKSLLVILGISLSLFSLAQTTQGTTTAPVPAVTKKAPAKKKPTVKAPTPKPVVEKKKPVILDLSTRASDHLMIQYGGDAWTNRPDSVNTGGFSRHFNIYLMFDKPFQTNQKFSLAYGLGIGSSNIFFSNTKVDVKSISNRLPFTRVDSTDHFKKFKVTTIYAEAPVELRYFADPENPGKSWKAAIGVKVGTLLKSYSKGKDLVTKSGNTIYGTGYVLKESQKRFFNGTMLAVTGRVGYGIFSIDAGYQINGVLKDGTGPVMNKFSVGVTISGL